MIRKAVEDLVKLGPLPSEEDVTEEQLLDLEALIRAVALPLSTREAVLIAQMFGDSDDTCDGLAWTLLHLVETHPTAKTFVYPNPRGNYWVERLNARVLMTNAGVDNQ